MQQTRPLICANIRSMYPFYTTYALRQPNKVNAPAGSKRRLASFTALFTKQMAPPGSKDRGIDSAGWEIKEEEEKKKKTKLVMTRQKAVAYIKRSQCGPNSSKTKRAEII